MKRYDKDLGFILTYENVAWYEKGAVKILDRRIYPTKIEFVTCHTHEEVAKAIADMVTQSAGPYTACSMGMALAAYQCKDKSQKEQIQYLKQAAHTLSHARPTTIARMSQITSNCLKIANQAMQENKPVDQAIFQYTITSLNRRYSIMEKVGENLANLFPNQGGVMTQCFGETIVGMMLRAAKKQNKNIKLYVPETRPYFQGARLTSSVCQDMGFDTTVITDNMCALIMKQEKVNLFTSAADVIALDGHITNKIGTYQIAILAKYHQIPYFVTGIPDKDIKDIHKITIEERDPNFVLQARGVQNTAKGVKGYYPSFDITPPHLISAIVTDKDIYTPYTIQNYFSGEVKQFY